MCDTRAAAWWTVPCVAPRYTQACARRAHGYVRHQCKANKAVCGECEGADRNHGRAHARREGTHHKDATRSSATGTRAAVHTRPPRRLYARNPRRGPALVLNPRRTMRTARSPRGSGASLKFCKFEIQFGGSFSKFAGRAARSGPLADSGAPRASNVPQRPPWRT